MNYIIFVFSYNSKDKTQYVYDTLKSQGAIVKVLENSTTHNAAFESEDTIDLGRNNIGIGGFQDYILENCLDEKINFYGFFTNDVYNFSSNYIESIESNFNENIGILHSKVDNDILHPWVRQIGVWNNMPTYNFIENIVPFYNYKLLVKYKSLLEPPIKNHYYGWMDGTTSSLSNILGLYNIILNECHVSHDRGGIRKNIIGNYEDYIDNAGQSFSKFLNQNPKLKEVYQF
jgi:hypothetical protein